MLNLQPEKPGKNGDDSLIPMINIVFLLLIFFMIAGQINTLAPAELTLPASASESDLEATELVISISHDARLLLNGEAVTGTLTDALKSAGADENTEVVCRADHQLPASALDPVMQAVNELKITHIRFVTEKL